VPEAGVDEDQDSRLRENKVWRSVDSDVLSVTEPGSPDAISDATNCRFASSHRTVVPESPLTCNTGGSEAKRRFCAPFSVEK